MSTLPDNKQMIDDLEKSLVFYTPTSKQSKHIPVATSLLTMQQHTGHIGGGSIRDFMR